MPTSPDSTSISGCAEIERCPYCGGRGSIALSGRDPVSSDERVWPYDRCHSCGAAWSRRIPSDLSTYYPAQYYTHSPACPDSRIRDMITQAMLAARYGYPAEGIVRAVSHILRAIPVDTGASRFLRHVEGGRVLDVGCGSGDFLDRLGAYGWETHGIEPDERAACICSSRGIRAIHSDAEHAVLPANYFDAITLHHSLEHLRNPAGVIARLAHALKPTGTLIVVTPNALGFPARKFGSCWRSLDPPRHVALATPRALRVAMERAGLAANIKTTSRNVYWVCRASLALRDGGSLRFQPSRWKVSAFAAASKAAAVFDPLAGEEIICIAARAAASNTVLNAVS